MAFENLQLRHNTAIHRHELDLLPRLHLDRRVCSFCKPGAPHFQYRKGKELAAKAFLLGEFHGPAESRSLQLVFSFGTGESGGPVPYKSILIFRYIQIHISWIFSGQATWSSQLNLLMKKLIDAVGPAQPQ